MDKDNKFKDNEYTEKLIKLNRVAKVVKGGRRFSFSQVVVGDKKKQCRIWLGKATKYRMPNESVEKANGIYKIPVKPVTIPMNHRQIQKVPRCLCGLQRLEHGLAWGGTCGNGSWWYKR